MLKEEVLEVDKRGWLEIPGFRPLDKFYLVKGKDYVLLKKLEEVSSLERFDELAKQIQSKFKEEGIKKSDIEKSIKWARKK